MDPQTSERWLSLDRPAQIEEFLRARSWIDADEPVDHCERAGEGNMNLTVRVVTPRRSLVLKQSRPWVEKYPDVAAPVERGAVEAAFYERVAHLDSVARCMPRLLAWDSDAHALLFEDLGTTSDFMSMYGGAAPTVDEVEALAAWCTALHEGTRAASPSAGDTDLPPIFHNRAMRELNHAHIFVLPFGDDLDLDLETFEDGLGVAAARLRADGAVQARVRSLADRYLADGPCLVHGDYYPGSWMRTEDGLRILDPEFCFTGPPEFDLAVALAHFALSECGRDLAAVWMQTVRGSAPIDESLVTGFAATEVVRRLIGLAQLPLPESTARVALLERATRVLASGPDALNWEALWP